MPRSISHYAVTADHLHPDYRFERTPVRVYEDGIDGDFSAMHSKLGCGKPRATPEDAIHELFENHACTVISIERS